MPVPGLLTTRDDLVALVAHGESETLEFKGSTSQLTAGCQSVCGMINARGGRVLFGVSDKGALVGQTVSEATLREVSQALRLIDPPSVPTISTVAVDGGKSVIIITCTASEKAPHTFDGRPYLRSGSTTRLMPQPLVEDRIQERLHPRSRWELMPVPQHIRLEHLDQAAIGACVRMAVERGRLAEPADDAPATILRGLGLIRDGQLINAAVICFGQNSCLPDYPQMLLRMARFRGTTRLADFDDNRQEQGHIFGLLTVGERFLRDHNPIAGRVEPTSWTRNDRPRYAPRAVREALANALVHRDYAMHGGSAALAIYDDRLEITNPGRFHFGMTPDDLTRPHESKPWNPAIANVFYRAGIIEQWGTGSLNIIQWCKDNTEPAPVWEQAEAQTVRVTFRPAEGFAPHDTPHDPPHDPPHDTPQVSEAVAALLTACAQPASRSELQTAVGVKDRMDFKRRYLQPALVAGVIEPTIPEKPSSRHQRYRLTSLGRHWRKLHP